MDYKAAVEKATTILEASSKKDNRSVSSFGVFGERKEMAWLRTICHADLKRLYNHLEEDSWYYSAIRSGGITPDETPDLKAFGNFLLSDNSPWQGITKGREKALLEKDGIVYGFLLKLSPDDEANLLAHLSIAGRIPQEHEGSYQVFSEFVKEGLSPVDSAYLCTQFSKYGDRGLTVGGFNGFGHSIFDNHLVNFRRWQSGTPKFSRKRPIKKEGYENVNDIFAGTTKAIPPISKGLGPEREIRGRWSIAKTGVDTRSVLDLWEKSYKSELLAVAA